MEISVMSLNMYSLPKKKKEVDPNAPPRPTLLGHEKEMKGWREQFGKLATTNTEQAIELAFLKRKMNRMQGQIDALISYTKRK
jgi:hypothetical protein